MKAQQHFDKKTIGVVFGGRSAEHEISIITGLQAISAIDTLRYRIVPIYIHPSGRWYTGEALLDRKFYKKISDPPSQLTRVTLLPDPTVGGILVIEESGKLVSREMIPIDAYFLALHGQHGEDGCLQGLLELADAAYTGCGLMASAVAMNKYACKRFLQSHGIPVLPAMVIRRNEVPQSLACLQKKMDDEEFSAAYPLFVKPCHLGSSIGISTAHNLEELHRALAKVFRYDDEAIIEPCITQLMEINISILEGSPPLASVVEIPIAAEGALTYEDKYMRDGKNKASTGSSGMAALSRVINPEGLDSVLKRQVREYALKAFALLDCSGVSRFDFMVDLSNGQLYFNELNPIPGSFAYYLWEKSDPCLLYTEIIDHLIEGAENRRNKKLSLQFHTEFKVV